MAFEFREHREYDEKETEETSIKETGQIFNHEIDASEPRIEIETIAALNILIDRHPYVKERHDFEQQQRNAEWYIVIKNLQKAEQLNHMSIREISQRTGINVGTLSDWLRDKFEPKIIRTLKIHEATRRRWEASLSIEAKQRCIDPSKVYYHLRFLRGSNKEIIISDFSAALEKLYSSISNQPKVVFAKLSPYHRTGPRWLREISKRIELHQKAIEQELNEGLGFSQKPLYKLQISIANHSLYFWRRNTNSENWLNVLDSELFFFKNSETPERLVKASRKTLDLDSNPIVDSVNLSCKWLIPQKPIQ